jgi:hypothetical protein
MRSESTPTRTYENWISLPFLEKLRVSAVYYLSIWTTAPILAYGFGYRIAALGSLLLWFVLELFNPRGIFRKPSLPILILFLYLSYTLPVIYMTDGTPTFLRFLQFYIIMIFFMIGTSYSRKGFLPFRTLVLIQIVLFTLWDIATYLALLENSHAARFIGKSTGQAQALQEKGVGGFAFVYALLVYIFGLMEMLRHRFRKKKFLSPLTLFMLFSLFLSVIVVLKAEYTTAVILLVTTSILYFFHSKSLGKNIFLGIIAITLYVVITANLVEILEWIHPYTYGTNYYIKIRDLLDSLQFGEAVGTAADRTERYIRSTLLFLEHPISGTWTFTVVGKHSYILDTFAQFGIFAGAALLYIILKFPISYYRRHPALRHYSFAMTFLVLALFGLNNVAMSYGFMFYIFFPTVVEMIEKDRI